MKQARVLYIQDSRYNFILNIARYYFLMSTLHYTILYVIILPINH